MGLALLAAADLVLYFSILPMLPPAWNTPGSPPLYLLGVAGGALLLVSMGFVLAKRTRRGGAPPAWLFAHVVAAIIGMVLVAVHSAGFVGNPPALLFLVLIALAIIGIWARTRVSRRIAETFATRYGNFRPVDPVTRHRLGEIIEKKTGLLQRLDPTAAEGTFSLTPAHWFQCPLLSLAYGRLVSKENRLIGARRSLPVIQAYWRRVHIMLSLLFVVGLLIHIFTVTFFAEFAAQGREVTWPHFSMW